MVSDGSFAVTSFLTLEDFFFLLYEELKQKPVIPACMESGCAVWELGEQKQEFHLLKN